MYTYIYIYIYIMSTGMAKRQFYPKENAWSQGELLEESSNLHGLSRLNPSSQQKSHSHECHGSPLKYISMVGHTTRCPWRPESVCNATTYIFWEVH